MGIHDKIQQILYKQLPFLRIGFGRIGEIEFEFLFCGWHYVQ